MYHLVELIIMPLKQLKIPARCVCLRSQRLKLENKSAFVRIEIACIRHKNGKEQDK